MHLDHLTNLNGDMSPTGSSSALNSGNIMKAGTNLCFITTMSQCVMRYLCYYSCGKLELSYI